MYPYSPDPVLLTVKDGMPAPWLQCSRWSVLRYALGGFGGVALDKREMHGLFAELEWLPAHRFALPATATSGLLSAPYANETRVFA